MANKTTTTTRVYSRKNEAGEWEEYDREVTTVVERDDEGFPYGPLPPFTKRYNPYYFYDPGFLRSRKRPKNNEEPSGE